MIIIAHRGNIDGPNCAAENTIAACETCLNKGFSVELDVWLLNGQLLLSHHYPDTNVETVPNHLLVSEKIWWHAKNISALQFLLNSVKHCFWHETDSYTLTKSGKIWTYPGARLSTDSIAVLPEISLQKIPKNIFGVCTDYPLSALNYVYD